MKVFGIPLSPFVRKVYLVAAEKGIAVEAMPALPTNPSPEFLAASPFRKIPALQDGDFTLCDSTAIVTYLDALHPDPPMLPGDARQQGTAIWFEEFADTVLTPAGGKIVFNRFVGPKFLGLTGDEAVAIQGEADLVPIFAYFEGVAPTEGWLTGDALSIGDIAVASVFRTLGYVGIEPDVSRHPRTAAWYARVCARPAWQAVSARETKIMAKIAG